MSLSVWERYRTGRRVYQEGFKYRDIPSESKEELRRLVHQGAASGAEKKFWDLYYGRRELQHLDVDQSLRDIAGHVPGAKIEVYDDGLVKYVTWRIRRPVVYIGVAKRFLGQVTGYEDVETGETRSRTYGIGVDGRQRFKIGLHRIGAGSGTLEDLVYHQYDHDGAGGFSITVDGIENEGAYEKIRDAIADLLSKEMQQSAREKIHDYSRDESPHKVVSPGLPFSDWDPRIGGYN